MQHILYFWILELKVVVGGVHLIFVVGLIVSEQSTTYS